MVRRDSQKLYANVFGLMPLLLVIAIPNHAKSVDYTPDVTSDAYWDSHHIGAVRVTAAGSDEQGRPYVTYQWETRLSDGPAEKTATVLVSRLWFGTDPDATPHVAVNDRLILFSPKGEPGAIVATRLDSGPQGTQTWNTLTQIASLRANRSDPSAYVQSALSTDSTVSRYALRSLLDDTGLQAQDGFRAELLQLRDGESRDTRVRVLANRLAAKLAGSSGPSVGEYVWLQDSLARSKIQDWNQLAPFVDRLLEFESQRPDLVTFFTQLATNPGATESARIAAYSTFEDPRMFHFDMPDALSGQIFQTSLQLLKDPEPAMRAAGAVLLHNIARRVTVGVRAEYLQNARAAIGEALAAESDDGARETLEFYLELISK
jgi:hypothetical protein